MYRNWPLCGGFVAVDAVGIQARDERMQTQMTGGSYLYSSHFVAARKSVLALVLAEVVVGAVFAIGGERN
jgi:hypothetical protein